MNLLRFSQSSGFKILALARLSQCEYSTVLYFLNLAASGMDQIITTESEVASLMGFTEEKVKEALLSLSQRKIITLHYSTNSKDISDHNSMRIGFQFDTSKWLLTFDENVSEKDAIVYPFRREGKSMLKLFDGQKDEVEKAQKDNKETWARVLNHFSRGRLLDEAELEENTAAAKILIETHPVDQVLIFLKHFDLRIPSLSLLASSWQHFQELFASETQKVDILGARQKHQELDEKLRHSAKEWLEKSEKLELSEEDQGVLNILIKHRHPRRQLFWAYQLRSRYERLKEFFEENASIMIPITTNGMVIKKRK